MACHADAVSVSMHARQHGGQLTPTRYGNTQRSIAAIHRRVPGDPPLCWIAWCLCYLASLLSLSGGGRPG
jgi:hypothetical protein